MTTKQLMAALTELGVKYKMNLRKRGWACRRR